MIVAELETDDGMGDPRRSPIRHEQIDATKLAQVDGSGQPLTGIFEFSTVSAVTKIMNGDAIAIDVSPWSFGVVFLPVTIV